jgi:hypothetical protein
MHRRTALPLLLLAVWSPLALAFPPCPQQPIRVNGVSSIVPDPAPNRFQAWFELIGDDAVLDALAPELRNQGGLPGTGNCRGGEDIQLPGPNTAGTSVGLPAALGPRAGYGLIALPDLRTEPAGYGAIWRYEFNVDDVPLPAPHNWVDVIELTFYRSDWPIHSDDPASIYRVRVLRPAAGPQLLQVIEIRGPRTVGPFEVGASEQVVATIPLNGAGSSTPVALRWTQTVRSVPAVDIDASLEVIGPGGQALYTAPLPSQWANGLSIGLLNHHAPELPEGSWLQGAQLLHTRLLIEGSGS